MRFESAMNRPNPSKHKGSKWFQAAGGQISGPFRGALGDREEIFKTLPGAEETIQKILRSSLLSNRGGSRISIDG